MRNVVPHRARGLIAVLVAAVAFGPSTIAWADDTGTPDESTTTTTTTTLAPDTTTTTLAPETTGTETPDAGLQAAALTTSPECEPETLDTSAEPSSTESLTTEGGAECDPTVEQQVDATNTGNAVADTGNNYADNTITGGTTEPELVDGLTATIQTGGASATGGDNATAIAQTAAALVSDDARIVIYQLAVVLNVGIAMAQTGSNNAAAGPEASTNQADVTTGDATATGLTGSTAVTQAVHLLDANNSTEQSTAVVNVGVGTANSGGNLAILHTGPGVDPTAIAVTWGPTAGITTGDATAVGDASRTSIVQVAIAQASDDGVIYIKQQAIVVNFGAAFANSGGNGAFAGGNSDSMLIDAIVTALVLALLDAQGLDIPEVLQTGSGTGLALVDTGNAKATGNTHETSIKQIAEGSVSGDHVASAEQYAAVGNYGIATANTGLNTAGDASSPVDLLIASTVSTIVEGLVGLAKGPVDAGDWSAALAVGNMFLEAYSELSAADWSSTEKEEGGPNSRVRIRQVVAVLNLMFALAISGQNQASTSNTPTEEVPVRVGADALFEVANGAVGVLGAGTRSSIRTGNATADGADVEVVVCQTINVSTKVCPKHDTPKPPPDVIVPVQIPTAKVPAATTKLAFTGSSSATSLALLGGLLLVLGAVLLVTARRRAAARP